MFETLRLMKQCTNQEYLNTSLEDLVEQYKKNLDAGVRNKIIAAMFINLFPMILKIQEKYYSLTNEQKVEHAIFHLIRSIKYYKNTNVKFSSFYYTHLTNQMKTLLTSENNLKKAAFQNIVRNNEEVLNIYTQSAPDKSIDNDINKYIECLKENDYLSSEEKDFCICMATGYTKTREIAERLNLENNYTFKGSCSNPLAVVDIQKQKELKEKAAIRKVRKIKESIKQKYEKYGMLIFT